MSFPSNARGITFDCTAVGARNPSFTVACSSLVSKPIASKLDAVCVASSEGTGIGVLVSSSLRFIIASLLSSRLLSNFDGLQCPVFYYSQSTSTGEIRMEIGCLVSDWRSFNLIRASFFLNLCMLYVPVTR